MIRLSGITPSGHVQLGNYLGAIRRWAVDQTPGDLYPVTDLHAMTTPHNPARLRSLTREQFAVLMHVRRGASDDPVQGSRRSVHSRRATARSG
jgi:tryptophanyl-tRNA synthetase